MESFTIHEYMNRGMLIPKLDHRDRDFLKTFHPEFAGAKTLPVFPEEFSTDAGLWVPNQNIVNPEFPKTGPQPYGCTNYTSCDLAADLDGKLRDPGTMEALTHANANGGYDVRRSLMTAKSLGLISGFYNIKAYAPLDYFDALRLASISGLPEKRSVSVGTPWYTEWQRAAERHVANVPMPLTLDYTGLGWHNWKVGGWRTVNGYPYLRAKIWEGKDVGDGGWLDFPRPVINAVMNLKYTIAFTATHITPDTIKRIDMTLMDTFISKFRTALQGLRY